MQQADNTPTTTTGRRRALLGGTAMASALATASADTAARSLGADAELIELGRAFDAWEREEAQLNDAYVAAERRGGPRDPDAERIFELQVANSDEYHRLMAEIGSQSATTLAGLAVKARATMSKVDFRAGDRPPEPDHDHYPAWSLARDVLRLAREVTA